MEVRIVGKGDIEVKQARTIRWFSSPLMSNSALLIEYVDEDTDSNLWIKNGKIFGQWDLAESLNYIERIDFYVFGKVYTLYEFTVEEIVNTLDFLK